MSKQSEAREAQGYTRQMPHCGVCKHFESYFETYLGPFGSHQKESNFRCTLGGFKVHKTGTCNSFERKETK